MFDGAGVPLIADFGISSITFNPISNNASTPFNGYSLRWAAPEILEALNDESKRPTKRSDVYAFGMVAIEVRYASTVSTDLRSDRLLCKVFTGKLPFPDVSDINVQLMVMKGKRPPKPADASKLGLSSATWKLVEKCWNKKRDKRPEIQYIALRLRKA